MDLFKLLGTISINNSDANKALDDTSDKGEKAESKLGKAFSAVGKGAVAVGKTIGAGLAAGATAMAGLTTKALSAVGELEQNMGGSEQVFQQYAGKMQETAKQAFTNMGLSTSDFLATANKMGALFQGAGFDIETSARISTDAMQRAADVASIMGIDTASAMEAIAGAAKGNFTMMDNLGVAMNDTTLQAYALEKGISKSTREMTNQEKIGLAMEMFMEKTAYAAGNYSRENSTLAGSLGTAKAALTNFLDGSGDVDQLVIAFTGAVNSIVTSLDTVAPRLVSGVVEIVNQITPQISPLLQKLLPTIVEGAVSLIDGLVTALPQLLSVLVNDALPMLLEGFVTIMNSVIEALPQIVQMLVSALPTLLPALIDGLVSMIVTLCTNFSQIIQPIIDILPELIVILVTTLLENLPILLEGVGQLVIGIVMAIPQLLQGLWNKITELASEATSMLFDKIKEWILKLFPQSGEAILKVLGTIKDAFVTWIDNLKEIFSVIVSVISTPFKLAWEGIKLVWNTVVSYFKLIWENIKVVFSIVDSVLSGNFKGAWDGIKKIWSNCVQFFKDIISNVKTAFSNVADILTEPFRKGKEAIGKIVDNIKGFFTGLKLKFPDIPLPHFGISPSGWKIGDLLKGSIPKLKVDWYAKGGIMKQPTLFDYDPLTGTAKVGGEAGDEAVAPISTLQQYIKAAVKDENTAMVQKLERIIDLLVQFFPELLDGLNLSFAVDGRELANALAYPMDEALGKITIMKGRGR